MLAYGRRQSAASQSRTAFRRDEGGEALGLSKRVTFRHLWIAGGLSPNGQLPQAGMRIGNVDCSDFEADSEVEAALCLRNGNETGFNNCRRNCDKRFRTRCT
jgi:hypothetical protein